MQAKHRAFLEVLVLIGLCIAIAQAFSRELGGGYSARSGIEAAAVLSFLAAVPLLLGAGGVIYGVWRIAIAMTLDVSLLTGALWELVRLMENYNRNASTGR